MGVSSTESDALYADQNRHGNFVPVEYTRCNKVGCTRPVYDNKKCKWHYDMLWYHEMIKKQNKKRK